MPPIIALFLVLLLSVFLLKKDSSARGKMSPALWIPLIWLLIKGSRPVALWLGMGAPNMLAGNPIDAVIDLVLMVISLLIVNRRINSWGEVFWRNWPLILLLTYFLVSLLWAPYPFVAFKRWFRELGNILIALVILTDRLPVEAFKSIAVRCAYMMFPLSIVLGKYFPAYGRDYSRAGGEMITGVTQQKNSLGLICCVFGLALVWDILDARRRNVPHSALLPQWFTLGCGVWLLYISRSQTSLMALIVGAVILLSTYIGVIRRHPIAWARLSIFGVSIALLMTTFATSLFGPLLRMMGRDATFTERTDIWNVALAQDFSSLVGTGFYSFMLKFGVALNAPSAHSGYLETYLDGGWIGAFFLVIFLLATSFRLARGFSHENTFIRVVFALTLMLIIANYTESHFLRLNVLWFAAVFASLIPSPAEPVTSPYQQKQKGIFNRRFRQPIEAMPVRPLQARPRTVGVGLRRTASRPPADVR